MEVLDDAGRERIDEALQAWRQGDCAVGEHWFLFRVDVDSPLTEDGAVAATAQVDSVDAEVFGFMLATQSCDIVRACEDRPFIEVCPLVRQRVVGCRGDDEARRLSLALARKRARVAFPDDFVAFASQLVSRMSSKHDKESDEGRALRSLREIRVRAAPSWDAHEVQLVFLFIRNENEPQYEEQGWDHQLEAWLKRVQAAGRFVSVDGIVQTLDDLTAREYVESDPLDLDHLSTR